MLRWEVGDAMFKKILQGALSQYTDKSMRSSDFEKVAEAQSQQQLTPFFAQWVDGTGAPQFVNKYAVYRLGNNKGFRTIGEIQQDLDLFRMPVELRVETDGKTEMKKVEVVGSDSQFIVDTFGRPRHISIDPDDWLLKATPGLQVRVSILKGQQLVAQGDLAGALGEFQKRWKLTRRARWQITVSARCCFRSGITRPAPMLIAMHCAAMVIRAGPRSGVTSS
jgi:aminopeptidase N